MLLNIYLVIPFDNPGINEDNSVLIFTACHRPLLSQFSIWTVTYPIICFPTLTLTDPTS